MQLKIQRIIVLLRKAEDELIETNDIDIKLIRQVKQLIFNILKEIVMSRKYVPPRLLTSKRWCEENNINPDDIIKKIGWDQSNDQGHYSFNNVPIKKENFDSRIEKSKCVRTAGKYKEDMSK